VAGEEEDGGGEGGGGHGEQYISLLADGKANPKT